MGLCVSVSREPHAKASRPMPADDARPLAKEGTQRLFSYSDNMHVHVHTHTEARPWLHYWCRGLVAARAPTDRPTRSEFSVAGARSRFDGPCNFVAGRGPASPRPGSHPGPSRSRSQPGVRRTPGITAAAAAPGAVFTVMPRVGPTSPRARASVPVTSIHAVCRAKHTRTAR